MRYETDSRDNAELSRHGWGRKVRWGTTALASLLTFSVISAATSAADLSSYRDYQFGTDPPAVALKADVSAAQLKTIHSRPALIQELAWRPQSLGSSQTESVEEVIFRFYDNELFCIAVHYDRYGTEGLTANDLVDVISATYGPAERFTPAEAAPGYSGDQEDIVAQWQDPEYRFNLIRVSYGPSFRLVGVVKRLESPAQAAALEAKRLDVQDAPKVEAARIASEDEAARAKLKKARLANKPKFRL